MCCVPPLCVLGAVVPGMGVPSRREFAISAAVARLAVLSSPEKGLSRPSGPVEPLRELQATLPVGVAVLSRWGRVSETEERE